MISASKRRHAEQLSQLHWMRRVSLLEGSTLLLLVCVGVPLKHVAGYPAASAVIGPIHGLAFLLYVYCMARMLATGGWSRSEIVRLVIAAVIPFGAFVNERHLKRKQSVLLAQGETA
ncbi:membrane protein [Herbaspirillum hiltneri N3]|uniref:Membrane protein n=1 Tax=Herbaspirillum hiltneri N3 TaxID=1262470 RepID=A0ABM5V108_9BURK|nr:DUF3817 domain-containing protein [Herbaspirillum hiltneri]AKZ63196.1 membrane protein [Herbaspirillum hiltneri N3]